MNTDVMQRPVRRGGIVGPVILISAGVLFLLANMGRINWSVWETLFRLWPVLLIAVGLDLLIGRRSLIGSLLIVALLLGVLAWAIQYAGPVTAAGQPLTGQQVSVTLDGAKAAELDIAPGVGELKLSAASEDAGLIEGQASVVQGEQVESNQYMNGDTLHYSLHSSGAPAIIVPGNWSENAWQHRVWDLKLNRDIPITLKVETGVGQTTADLSQIRVTHLQLNTGIGTSLVTLPKQGRVTASVDGGIGEVRVLIPAGVAAHVHVDGGVGETKVLGNFRKAGNEWTSPGYDSAENRVDLRVSGGLGSIVIQSASQD
jgi:hypothetical protein